MTDTEKKITEIREALEKIDRGDLFEIAMAHEKSREWLRFLLDELERLEREYAEERAAHNAHVTELCELGKENRKLLEERDEARRKAEEAWKEIDSLEEQLLSSQQEIERLREERDKLIEGLRWYADEIKYMNWPSELWINQGQRARDILKEIGVTVG